MPMANFRFTEFGPHLHYLSEAFHTSLMATLPQNSLQESQHFLMMMIIGDVKDS